MLYLDLSTSTDEPLTVLCLGAHADDIEIGCGAAVLELSQRRRGSHFHWVVLSARGERRAEAEASAEQVLAKAAKRTVQLYDFRDGYLPYAGGEVKDRFEALAREVEPDLVLTHYRHDLHQDHRIVSELTWNTFRNHLILEYEIPKYDGDLGSPNVFLPLDREAAAAKVKHVLQHFPSQRERPWFTQETFFALLRLRGLEARSPGGYAEAFYGRKLPLRLGGASR